MNNLENNLLEKMSDLIREIIKKQDYFKIIKDNKKGFYVTICRNESEEICKDFNEFKGDIYYLKLAHKTREEYEERLKKQNQEIRDNIV